MGMTMTQKILAAHAGLDSVKAGQFIEAKLDAVLANDITGPVAIKNLPAMGAEEVFDKDRVYLIPDHFTPNKDIKAAEQCKVLREFARDQKLTNYFEVGRVGIEHALLPEQGGDRRRLSHLYLRRAGGFLHGHGFYGYRCGDGQRDFLV